MVPFSTNVRMHQVDVSLNQNNGVVSLSDNNIPLTVLQLEQGIHMIRFEIATSDPELFPSSPLLWVDENGIVAAQPPGMQVHWLNPREFALVIFNAIRNSVDFFFKVVVTLGGQVFSSNDPTIICDPPGTTS